MPQSSQFIGVNSVTNIELDKGDMPAPIIRNADWLENFPTPRIADRNARATGDVRRRLKKLALRIRSVVLTLYRIVANGRFTRGECLVGRIQDGWQADL